ncbi:LamG domain-containing protein [Spirosoma aureum]|uniref:LamG domain-containing protein n=1 Tax=Spirosoma aureum TaxID=2692134 RepID=A0A6G9AIN1_9BACT|nr:LamG domain-containing protein [Spirosoma aureum]QIP12332.1 LamG domain-containing protein [Spirosoma aureum]
MKTRQITTWVVAGVVMSTVFTSCKKEDTPSLPDIGGYASSNDIASASLLAHFPFDGNNIERKSGTAGTALNASFTTGASGQGQALNLNAGYVSFPALSALTSASSLPSFTISAWVNVKNNGTSPSSFVTIARAGEWAGSVNLLAETGQRKATSDTLNVKGLLVQKASDGNASFQDNINSPDKGGDQAFKNAGKWSHLVFVYDASTSKITLYGNGKKINNPDYESRAYNGAPLGNLTLFPVTNVIIGAWGTNLPGGKPDSWQTPMTGQVDEVRIYSKALSVGDITSLYQLEQAGR